MFFAERLKEIFFQQRGLLTEIGIFLLDMKKMFVSFPFPLVSNVN